MTTAFVSSTCFIRDPALARESNARHYVGSYMLGPDKLDLYHVTHVTLNKEIGRYQFNYFYQTMLNGHEVLLENSLNKANIAPLNAPNEPGHFRIQVAADKTKVLFLPIGQGAGNKGLGGFDIPDEEDEKHKKETMFAKMHQISSALTQKTSYKAGFSIDDHDDTDELAQSLSEYASTPDDPACVTYRDRAIEFIKVFKANKEGRTRELYQQLTVLASSQHPKIAHDVLNLLLENLRDEPLLDLELLIAIGNTFEAAGNGISLDMTPIFSADQLVAALNLICEKWEALFKESEDHSKLQGFLESFTKTLNAMANSHTKGINYEWHLRMYQSIERYEKNHDEALAEEAILAKQALLSIRHDKTPAELQLLQILNVARGVSQIANSGRLKMDALEKAADSFRKAAQKEAKPAEWHQHFRLLTSLLKLQEWRLFKTHLKDADIKNMSSKHKLRLLQHLVFPLGVIIADRENQGLVHGKEITNYNNAINMVTALFSDHKEWGCLAQTIKDLEDKPDPKSTAVKIELLKELRISAGHQNEFVRKPAVEALKALRKLPESVIPKKWFDKAHIPENIDEIPIDFTAVKAVAPVRSQELWKKSGHEVGFIAKIKNLLAWWTDPKKNQELERQLCTYVASHGSIGSDFKNRFDVQKEVDKILANKKEVPKLVADSKKIGEEIAAKKGADKAVLDGLMAQKRKIDEEIAEKKKEFILMLGSTASGKTITLKSIARELAKKCKPEDKNSPIPVYIPLETIQTHSDKTIEEVLQRHPYNFSMQEIHDFKKEKREFIFLFDGYEEMGQKINLHCTYKLNEWNCTSIAACRSQYLIGKDSHYAQFAPLGDHGPLKNELAGIFITPFQSEDIWTYVDRYIDKSPTAPTRNGHPDWDLFKYQEEIKKIPNYEKLLSNPFLLFITLEILPSLVAKWKASGRTGSISTKYLIKAYMKEWNVRAETRLMKNVHVARNKKALEASEDIKRDFTKHSKEIAQKMGEMGVVSAKPSSEWNSLLGLEKVVLCEGAPLQKTGLCWEFIHPLVREYYESLQVTDQIREEGDKVDLSKISNFTARKLESKTLIDFYVETAKTNAKFKAVLEGFIEKSTKLSSPKAGDLSPTSPTSSTASTISTASNDSRSSTSSLASSLSSMSLSSSELVPSYAIAAENSKEILRLVNAKAEEELKIAEEDSLFFV